MRELGLVEVGEKGRIVQETHGDHSRRSDPFFSKITQQSAVLKIFCIICFFGVKCVWGAQNGLKGLSFTQDASWNFL